MFENTAAPNGPFFTIIIIAMETPHPRCYNTFEDFSFEERGMICPTCLVLGQEPACIGGAHPRRQGAVSTG